MEQLQPLILQSLEMLVIGMGTVFIILGLLILTINLVTNLVSRFAQEPEPPTFPTANRTERTTLQQDDREVLAVISAAINRYRKQNR